MDTVTLPPELERFATEAVAAGRFRDVSDVVAAGVSLLRRQEQARAELLNRCWPRAKSPTGAAT